MYCFKKNCIDGADISTYADCFSIFTKCGFWIELTGVVESKMTKTGTPIRDELESSGLLFSWQLLARRPDDV